MAHYNNAKVLAASLALLLASAAVFCLAAKLQNSAPEDNDLGNSKHPVSLSESKLRSIIAAVNEELRQLKHKFMRDMTDLYQTTRMDPLVGTRVAMKVASGEDETSKDSPASTVVTLMNQELAEMIIQKYTIERRLVSGLKVAFLRMLPMRTLRRLIAKHEAYAWLKGRSQIDVRPKFHGVDENQLAEFYALVELRARARAADDLYVLSAQGARRILKAARYWLVDHQGGSLVDEQELDLMKQYASRILTYYMDEIVNARHDAMEHWDTGLDGAQSIVGLAGGEAGLIEFIDHIINAEGLDIELSPDATRLDWPPTISQEMIAGLEARWIPDAVRESIGEDRKILIDNQRFIMNVVVLEKDEQEVDLGAWADQSIRYLCSDG